MLCHGDESLYILGLMACLVDQQHSWTRWLTALAAADGEDGLRRLGRLLYEAAASFYLSDARRRLAVHADRRTPPPELSARVGIKASSHAAAFIACAAESKSTFYECMSSTYW